MALDSMQEIFDQAAAEEGIARLEAFYHSLGLQTTLHEIGIGDEDFDRMAEHAAALMGGKVGEFVKLTADDIRAIYRLAL